MDLVKSLDLSEPDTMNILPGLVMLIQGEDQLREKTSLIWIHKVELI